MRLVALTDAEAEAVAVLQVGGIIACPTDTIYGLSCLAINQAAVRKINHWKGNAFDKPLILLASSLAMVEQYSQLSAAQKKLALDFWQEARPTSLILPQQEGNKLSFLSQNNCLSWRLPKSSFLLKIIETLGSPLVSTSFNKTGANPYEDVSSLLPESLEFAALDLIVDGGILKSQASRIIDLSGEDPLIIRP